MSESAAAPRSRSKSPAREAASADKKKKEKKTLNPSRDAHNNFVTYIHKLVDEVAATNDSAKKGITEAALDLTNNLIVSLARRISEASWELVVNIKKAKTIDADAVATAAGVIIPRGDGSATSLRNTFLANAADAVAKYNAIVKAKGGPKQSRAERADIIFPPPRAETLMRRYAPGANVSGTAPVYLAALLEAVAFAILAHAIDFVDGAGRKRINPAYIVRGIQADETLVELFPQDQYVTGVIPAPIDSNDGVRGIIEKADAQHEVEKQKKAEAARSRPKAKKEPAAPKAGAAKGAKRSTSKPPAPKPAATGAKQRQRRK